MCVCVCVFACVSAELLALPLLLLPLLIKFECNIYGLGIRKSVYGECQMLLGLVGG